MNTSKAQTRRKRRGDSIAWVIFSRKKGKGGLYLENGKVQGKGEKYQNSSTFDVLGGRGLPAVCPRNVGKGGKEKKELNLETGQ